MPILLKTLKLTLDGKTVECELSLAELVDNPETESITSFCGTEESAIPKYTLRLGGWQSYGAADSISDMLHEAYVADPVQAIDFVLTVGGKTRSGSAKPIQDPPFGGPAGQALTWEAELSVVGPVVDGTAV